MKRPDDHLPFTKMQGVGNDFVVVDGRDLRDPGWSGLAREVCHRHFGIGADGLLVIERSHRADVAMRMYNPDGTPDMCGNGLRCVARYVADSAVGSRARPGADGALTIATLAGMRAAAVRYAPGGECSVTVDMGLPRFAPVDIPMRVAGQRVTDYPLEVDGEVLPVTALSTGTAHAVILVDEMPDEETFQRLSPRIENHPLFPERTSVMWTRREDEALRVRIWERGAGETWGCGTGACAAAVAARLHGLVGEDVEVRSKGGAVTVHWRDGEALAQTGPAEYVFEGRYALDPDGQAA